MNKLKELNFKLNDALTERCIKKSGAVIEVFENGDKLVDVDVLKKYEFKHHMLPIYVLGAAGAVVASYLGRITCE